MNQIDARPSVARQFKDHEDEIEFLLKQLGHEIVIHGRKFRRGNHRDQRSVDQLQRVESLLREARKALNSIDEG